MKRKNTQLFVFTVLLAASIISVAYLSKASVTADMVNTEMSFDYEEEVEFNSPDVTVVQLLFDAAKQFFVIKD